MRFTAPSNAHITTWAFFPACALLSKSFVLMFRSDSLCVCGGVVGVLDGMSLVGLHSRMSKDSLRLSPFAMMTHFFRLSRVRNCWQCESWRNGLVLFVVISCRSRSSRFLLHTSRTEEGILSY